ncbi:hypothetical protein SAMN06265379_102226 [Saccharicrinis carchari]|uniref:Uncharacterized protein n=1 Tax=Saccharicrinis carchari TaxID=1168039 RepID=A0A521BYI5_SACCC|nr:hypothetical protein SAMN06265379_102226 [Saccharicrinis carchari]
MLAKHEGEVRIAFSGRMIFITHFTTNFVILLAQEYGLF